MLLQVKPPDLELLGTAVLNNRTPSEDCKPESANAGLSESETLVHSEALSFADSQSVPCIDEISSGTAAPVRSTTTTNG